MVLSEKISSGHYLLKHRAEFGLTGGKAALIFLPAALALGIITQLIYNWGFTALNQRTDFQGAMIVADISGSMLENDPYMEAVEAIASYIDTVPLHEYLGIILFNDQVFNLRDYSQLESEDERNELKQRVYDEVSYDGGTDIEQALLKAFSEIRASEEPDFPGIVLLFSDGESPINYYRIRNASTGNSNNEKNRIPVSAIYYSKSSITGSHMSLIAQETGGEYFHVGVGGDSLELRDIFSHSRAVFRWNTDLHLLKNNVGTEDSTVLRIILRSVFIALWGFLTGVFVVIFLNNVNLVKHFLIVKIIVSIGCGIAFTFVLLAFDTSNGARLARGLLVASMCTIYLPTYKWD